MVVLSDVQSLYKKQVCVKVGKFLSKKYKLPFFVQYNVRRMHKSALHPKNAAFLYFVIQNCMYLVVILQLLHPVSVAKVLWSLMAWLANTLVRDSESRHEKR